MGAFGGGLGGNGEVCGAVAGALAVFGLRFSRGRDSDLEDIRMWKFTRAFLKRFQEEIVKDYGSILCRDIARVDWTDREQVRRFYSGDTTRECSRIVGDTARLVGEMLEQTSR